MVFVIIMCCVYFIAWIYLLLEIVKAAKKLNKKNVGWIVLCAIVSLVSGFSLTLMRIFELL